MGPKQVLPLLIRVDLGVMAIKGYSTLPRSQELEPYYQMQFSVISILCHIYIIYYFGSMIHDYKFIYIGHL